jgi:hypothetical protein
MSEQKRRPASRRAGYAKYKADLISAGITKAIIKIAERLRQLGGSQEGVIESLRKSRRVIPSGQAILRFVRSEAFDEQFARLTASVRDTLGAREFDTLPKKELRDAVENNLLNRMLQEGANNVIDDVFVVSPISNTPIITVEEITEEKKVEEKEPAGAGLGLTAEEKKQTREQKESALRRATINRILERSAERTREQLEALSDEELDRIYGEVLTSYGAPPPIPEGKVRLIPEVGAGIVRGRRGTRVPVRPTLVRQEAKVPPPVDNAVEIVQEATEPLTIGLNLTPIQQREIKRDLSTVIDNRALLALAHCYSRRTIPSEFGFKRRCIICPRDKKGFQVAYW